MDVLWRVVCHFQRADEAPGDGISGRGPRSVARTGPIHIFFFVPSKAGGRLRA